ncbi:hypothetical protein Scep_019860 [Stephania cephalantha]|uniref:Uncharacterized protein n=1 Tax=Stephania cephalantha TaxID=152367 RepID=A0AAP0IBG6_9MAGN
MFIPDMLYDIYITSDCDAVATIFEYQGYVQSPEEAVAIAFNLGMDINCGLCIDDDIVGL